MSPFSHIDASPFHLIVEQHATKATINLLGLILVPGFSFIAGTPLASRTLDKLCKPSSSSPTSASPSTTARTRVGCNRSSGSRSSSQDEYTHSNRQISGNPTPTSIRPRGCGWKRSKRRVQRVAAGQQMMARLARAPKVSKTATAHRTVPA
ncbi:hypothetical protein C8F01DRAFT_1106593 [Mycena amicta]|nr:hypothetical protein C8F01DRAFT_1106593 [Mycena amicta]